MSIHPRIILAIARKDLFDAIKNMYLLFAIILPIGMSLLFRVLLGSVGSDGVLDIAVYDAGTSQLVQRLMDSKQFSMFVVASPEEVRQRTEKDLMAGIVIPANLDADIAAGKRPDLVIYINSQRGGLRQTTFRQIVEGSLRDMAGQTMPVRLSITEVSGIGASTFSLTSFYLLLFLIMSVTMVGVFIVPYILVEEKEKGTLKAILVSPASFIDVVIGKGLVGLFYALLVVVILMALNNGFVGNIPVTMLAVVFGSIFLVLVGLLMGAAFKTLSQFNSWSSIVMLALMLPGMFGDFLPPPEPIPTIMKFVPTSYMAHALTQGMAGTITARNAMIDLGALVIASVIAFAGVVWFLRRERQ